MFGFLRELPSFRETVEKFSHIVPDLATCGTQHCDEEESNDNTKSDPPSK